jgi:hypothetical protein
MNNNLLQIKIRQRLNKLSSFDYDNIECWMIQEAFNKAQLEWVRRRLHGLNAHRESSEQTVTVVDDLQILLSEINLKGIESPKYFETVCDCQECGANKTNLSLDMGCENKIATTTNSQGQTELVGSYIY